jgi:hypothetical protein
VKSATECLFFAADASTWPVTPGTPIDQAVLLAAVGHWRHLAGVAKSKDLVEAQEPWPGDRAMAKPRPGQ